MGQTEKDNVTALWDAEKEPGFPHRQSPHLWEDEAGTVGQGKEESHDLQQVLCLLEPQSPYLFSGEKEVYYLHPHFTDEEAEIRSRPSGCRAHVLSHNTVALSEQVRCESLLQTLLSVSRVVATKGTPREGGSLHKNSLQRVPENTPVLLGKNLIS